MPSVPRKAPEKNHVQSVLFEKDEWTEASSREWLEDNDYYTDGLDETESLYRWRQYQPDDDRFEYRNKSIGGGISLVSAFRKGRSMSRRLDDPDRDQTRASLKPAKPNEDGTYRYMLSDESMDSYSTRILVKGWSLKRFLSNPVVPWAHNYDIPPVGRAERVWKSVENGKPELLMDVRFMRPADYGNDWPTGVPSPVAIEAMTASGYLRGCSVGMRPMEWEFIRKIGENGKEDPRGEVVGIEYRKQELLEGSIVPLPSNANALARCLSEGHLTLAHLPDVYRSIEVASAIDSEMVDMLRREMASPRLFAVGFLQVSRQGATFGPTTELLDELRNVGVLARSLDAVPPGAPEGGSELAEVLAEARRGLTTALRPSSGASGEPHEQAGNPRTRAEGRGRGTGG